MRSPSHGQTSKKRRNLHEPNPKIVVYSECVDRIMDCPLAALQRGQAAQLVLSAESFVKIVSGGSMRNAWQRLLNRLSRSSRTISAIRYRVLARSWIARCRRHLSQRQRVAIGPMRGHPEDAVFGPRVVMVADWINSRSKHFDADYFFQPQDLLDRQYDAILIVKNFDDFTYEHLEQLKRRGTVLLYSVADNPDSVARSYIHEPQFLDFMDAIIAANPLQIQDFEAYGCGSRARLIPAPLRNTRVKRNYELSRPVRVIWQGLVANARLTEWLHPLFEKLADRVPGGLELIYHTDQPVPTDGCIRFIKWLPENWEQVLIGSDIAIAVKPPDNFFQARKPPTKVLTYMAAGVPVICTPSESDKLVVRHGINALVAHSLEEWRDALLRLIEDQEFRTSLARRGKRDAIRFASQNVVGKAHERLLLSLTGGAGWRKL